MKQVIVNIPDSKFEFFMELFQSLGVSTEGEVSAVHQWQKDITLKRAEELEKDPSKAISFDSMIDDLEQKYGL